MNLRLNKYKAKIFENSNKKILYKKTNYINKNYIIGGK